MNLVCKKSGVFCSLLFWVTVLCSMCCHVYANAAAIGLTSGVCVLSVDAKGAVFAGGLFDKAGGVPVNNIAKWDGAAWSGVGRGVDAGVTSLATDSSGKVYAGGWFLEAEGKDIQYAAFWNGKSWNAMSNKSEFIDEIVVFKDGSVYAVGQNSSNNVMKWTGRGWVAIGKELTGPSGLVAAQDGNLYVNGSMQLNGKDTHCIAKWDGGHWVSVAPSAYSVSFAVAPSGKIYMSESKFDGKPSIIKEWSGGSWNNLPIKGPSFGSLVVASDGTLYAAKIHYIDKTDVRSTVIRWDGKRLTKIDKMRDAVIYSLVIGPDNAVYIGGVFDKFGKVKVSNIAKWDGVTCTPLGSGVEF